MGLTQAEPAVSEQSRDEALIRLEGVGRRYQMGDTEVVALADVSFEVLSEEFVVVLGPSGCGKTTLLNMIGALDSPTEGRVIVAGRDITRGSRKELFAFRRHGVSFVFQTFNLFPALTALENAEFGADVAGRPDPAAVAAEMLERVGLGDRLRHFPHELSGGEQQRVAIARALASGNPTLLADEPTGELDFQSGSGLANRISVVPADGYTADDVKAQLLRLPQVAAVQGASATTDAVDQVMAQFNEILLITVAIAAVMALLIAFNATAINADERTREHATMFAHGVTVARVLRGGMVEALLVGALGTLVGVAAGHAVLSWIVNTNMPETIPDIGVLTSVRAGTYALAAAAGTLVVGAAPLLTLRRLRRTDISGALRVVE